MIVRDWADLYVFDPVILEEDDGQIINSIFEVSQQEINS
jgi:hypothetical protein